ncbi:MAG: ATP-binding region ATPase domain protein [Gemmatimonadetes bacterium]|nr:ATP-binding region ATPase domain protein [Gemmatimonadota bacterium]
MNTARLRSWLLWFIVLAATASLLMLMRARLDEAHFALAFLLVVLAGSAAEGRALGVALAGVAFVVFNWFFLRPYNTLIIEDPRDWLVLVAFLVTGIVAAQLLERQRQATESARRRADEIDRLATLGAETLKAPRAAEALDAIAAVIREAMGVERCSIFRWDASAGLRLAGQSPAQSVGDANSALLSYTVENAMPAAERADGTLTILSDALAAERTDSSPSVTLADLSALGIPLAVSGKVVGALRLSAVQPFGVTDDQRRVLGALSYYAALGIERLRLAGAEEEAESLRRADRLKDALLAAVSHDLRTPLTAIKGIANEIWRGGDPSRAQIIEEEADRLNAQVGDLLELSQINAGVLPLTVTTNAVDDVVGAALDRVESVHGAGRIDVRIANDDAILVGDFDFMHTMRALTNLLENALKYSPSELPVQLEVVQLGDRLRFTVEDRGPGIPAGDEQKIFAPFYRGSAVSDGVRGTGLGLSIARQLIEAQRGTLEYAPRTNGGSRFTIDLPAAAQPRA